MRRVVTIGAATVLLGCLAVGGGSGCATTNAHSDPLLPDAVIGTWKCNENGAFLRIERRDDHYVMLGIADRTGALEPPDVVGEFRREQSQQRLFTGRHIWGGRWGTKIATEPSWGDEGGLIVRQVTLDEIFIQYTDSRYKGGWTYRRQHGEGKS